MVTPGALRMRRMRERMRAEFKAMLGGRCSHPGCGKTRDLEFDHKDPATREIRIGNGIGRYPVARLLEELAKCQLLCKRHHKEKTAREKAARALPLSARHGKLSTYYKYKCRCEACRRARSEYYHRHLTSKDQA